MTETKVEITGYCALVCTRYGVGIAPDVVIRYTEHSQDYWFSDSVTEADIDADTARAMIAALVEAFGLAVLPGGGETSDRIDDGEVYDPRDIIDAIERLAVHGPDVAQRLLDGSSLERLRGATMGNARCDRLADMAAAAGCAEDYAARRELCQSIIIEAQVNGPAAAKELRDQRAAE